MQPKRTLPIYTTGYTGKNPLDLKLLVESTDAILCDIRFSPHSRAPRWEKSALVELLGERYRHVNSLGNMNYKTGVPIKIASLDFGIRLVTSLDKTVILLCACEHYNRCHRKEVAEALISRGFTVKELQDWKQLSFI